MRIALGIEYNGLAFYGWQTQPGGRTVQDTLEDALAAFVGQRVATICAGRTDSGVHATGQVVHLDAPVDRSLTAWVRGVNAYLPATVAVRWAQAVGDDFSARFSATARSYEYWLLNDPVRSPLYEGRTGWVFRPLDVAAMQTGALHLLGTHDFTSFRAAECQAATPIRSLSQLEIEARGRLVRVQLKANAFLHHMVRNIVGTLVYVGLERQSPEWVGTVLAARSRQVAAPTFSPAGLYLTGVEYDPAFALPATGGSPFA
ncbi:MAG: tRNA pseudouridine(38-40) synthase TruA [Burkholderiaceae bacterium]